MGARDRSVACVWVNPDVHQGGAAPFFLGRPVRTVATCLSARWLRACRVVLMRAAGWAEHFLMPEVAVTGEAHGHAAFIGGGDDIGIALAASWLDGGGGAGVSGGQQAVGEREKRVTGDD